MRWNIYNIAVFISHSYMKAIIPAAWYWTRMLPVTKTIPKEMLPIGNKPVIHYIVEWLVAWWITDIAIITSQGKSVLEDYFDKNYELENILKNKGKTDFLERINEPKTMANYVFMKQKEQLWVPHALLETRSWIHEEFFFVNLADQFWDPLIYKEMIDIHKKTWWPVIWLQEMPEDTLHKYWVAKVENWVITDMIEKPAAGEAPSNLVCNGLYILPHTFFEAVDKTGVDTVKWESLMPDCMLAMDVPLYPCVVKHNFWDMWTPEAWLKANNETFNLWLRK